MPPNPQETPPPADLSWRDDAIPVSRRFDDPYFSLAGGLAETDHVFLQGNRLPSRLQDGFRIAELGFGTGLNLMATIALWQRLNRPGTLHYTSFEAFPMAPEDLARAHAAFPDLAPIAASLAPLWTGATTLSLPGLSLRLILGDARATLPAWKGQADAWFLDGFSPAKNPEMWSEPLLTEVARHTAKGGTFATYTAAGHVRRALSTAGFTVTRTQGFARKRHMTVGQKIGE
jgi:tRNA U34 5-methylaminomethyl-2-thiouridine-forming methyltransferase MnmC